MPRDTVTRRAGEASDYAEPEEGDTPRRRVDRLPDSPASSTRRGWAVFEEVAAEIAEEKDFPDRYALGTEAELLMFLEDEPLQVWKEHWIQDAPDKRKSFPCGPTVREDVTECALCDELGDKPSMFVAFNVAVLTKGKWKHKVLVGRVRVAKAVQALSNGRATSPINKPGLYFESYRVGEGTESMPHFDRVLEAEIDKEEVIPAETLAEFKGKLWGQYAFVPKKEDVYKVVDAALRK